MTEAMPLNGQVAERDPEKAENKQRKISGGCREGCSSWFRANMLLVFTVFGITVGMALGFGLHPYDLSEETILAIGFPGDIFMRCLKLLILPLIITSLVTGSASLDAKSSGKLGARTVAYYLTTTTIAAIIGLVCVLSIQPGNSATKQLSDEVVPELQVSTIDAIFDLFRNMFPENLVQACFQQAATNYKDQDITKRVLANTTETELNTTYSPFDAENISGTPAFVTVSLGTKEVRQILYIDRMNVLGLIVFCIVFGILLGAMGPKGKVMVDFFTIIGDITMKMVMGVMWYSPIGILSLVCAKVLAVEDPVEFFSMLAMLIVTLLTALALHTTALTSIYFILTRKNPLIFLKGVVQALMTAFATQSSSATLPVTFRCLEENLGVDKRVTRFVLPVGAIINMDGTATYEAIGAIFIAQLNRMPLNIAQVIVISLTAILASIGAATVPSAGLVTMLMVLTAAGLPTEDVALLFTIDWFMDRCRTTVNVLGDSYGAAIVHHLLRDDLKAIDRNREAENEYANGKEYDDSVQSPGGNTVTSFTFEENNDDNAIINAYTT
ncbi:excitatory amino acid transporter-like [Amphiura filiformis]|uniref:excitatory amino acid transporter-like n=1 Tax=Amphiura filiformis TaxID=82378 RepID=UPI003B210DCD